MAQFIIIICFGIFATYIVFKIVTIKKIDRDIDTEKNQYDYFKDVSRR
jgi:hypothetical protein